jgi:hypothetical protein
MWRELRHAHIADVGNTASVRLKEFANSKLARVEREGVLAAAICNVAATYCASDGSGKTRIDFHLDYPP